MNLPKLPKIPTWLMYGLGCLAAMIIVFRKRDLLMNLPTRIKEVFNEAMTVEVKGEPVTKWVEKPVRGAWAAWLELCRPFANLVADALFIVYEFLGAPFKVSKNRLTDEPLWLPIFSIAAVFGAIGAFIKMYIQIKGFKPKAYYRSDFTPKTKEW